MENNASISPCSARILLELDNWTPSIPFPFENPDERNHAGIAKGHEVFLRCHICTVLYRKPETGFFKPPETPLFPTIFVGLTGFEPATFCSQSRRATKLRYSPFMHSRTWQVNTSFHCSVW